MSVKDGDIVGWMTVKGNHIPIRKGQNKEEAMISFLSQADDSNLFQDRTKDIKDGKALTRQEYAVWCKKLGEVKRGGAVHKGARGEKYIPIEEKDKLGRVRAKIVITTGTYENPKMKRVFEFKNNDTMYDFLSVF